MSSPLRSLIAAGTKLYLASIDPDLVRKNRALGATGATSNPIIVADLLKTGRFDGMIAEFAKSGGDASAVAWKVTHKLVSDAQGVFLPVESQVGLAGLLVRPVALEAVVRQDRQHVAGEIDRLLGGGGGGECQQE